MYTCFDSLDTSIGGLTFSDQFIQFATYLDTAKVYGLGEHEHQTFPHDTNWVKWGMWTRDQAVTVSETFLWLSHSVTVSQTLPQSNRHNKSTIDSVR